MKSKSLQTRFGLWCSGMARTTNRGLCDSTKRRCRPGSQLQQYQTLLSAVFRRTFDLPITL